MLKKVKNKYWCVLYLLFIFIIIHILNTILPLCFDDWTYSFIYGTDVRVSNIKDVFYSQYLHYFLWGGRSVAHSIVQFLLLGSKPVADFLNTSAFIILIYSIYVISKNSFKLKDVKLISIICSLLIICLPVSLETILWKTGSANYLWTTCIIIIYLMPFVFNIYKSGQYKAIPILMFLGGIIAGWTNENTAFSLVIAIFFFIYFFKKKYNKIPIWAIYGAIGVVIGFSLMILAPGNSLRGNKGYLYTVDFSYVTLFLIRSSNIINVYIIYLFGLTITYMLLYVVHNYSNHQKKNDRIFISKMFLLMSYISIVVMLASPEFPARAMFGSVTFSIISLTLLISDIPIYKKSNNLFRTIIIVLFFVCSYKLFVLYKDVSMVNRIMNEREVYVESCKEKNILDIKIVGEGIQSPTYTLGDLYSYKDHQMNKDYAKYKNINSIIFERKY